MENQVEILKGNIDFANYNDEDVAIVCEATAEFVNKEDIDEWIEKHESTNNGSDYVIPSVYEGVFGGVVVRMHELLACAVDKRADMIWERVRAGSMTATEFKYLISCGAEM